MKEELATKRPVAHPFDKNLTDRTKHWFGKRTEHMPDGLRGIAETACQQEKVDLVDALIKMCRTLCVILEELYQLVRCRLAEGEDLQEQMADLVNQEQMVKLRIQKTHGNPESSNVYIQGAEEGLGTL